MKSKRIHQILLVGNNKIFLVNYEEERSSVNLYLIHSKSTAPRGRESSYFKLERGEPRKPIARRALGASAKPSRYPSRRRGCRETPNL